MSEPEDTYDAVFIILHSMNRWYFSVTASLFVDISCPCKKAYIYHLFLFLCQSRTAIKVKDRMKYSQKIISSIHIEEPENSTRNTKMF